MIVSGGSRSPTFQLGGRKMHFQFMLVHPLNLLHLKSVRPGRRLFPFEFRPIRTYLDRAGWGFNDFGCRGKSDVWDVGETVTPVQFASVPSVCIGPTCFL